jgi:hypothetical protein
LLSFTFNEERGRLAIGCNEFHTFTGLPHAQGFRFTVIDDQYGFTIEKPDNINLGICMAGPTDKAKRQAEY